MQSNEHLDESEEQKANSKKPQIIVDENGNRNIILPKLTKLEEQYLQESYQKHKQNITKPQVVMGKVFKGVSFISKPEKIIFNDFEVNQTYTQTIHLTNVSNSFNSFKLQPLRDNVIDFFEIIFIPPGKMSAGMSCKVKIRFSPQLNEDINEYFPILAETGPIQIPLICTSKKAIVQLKNTNLIDFGSVIYGEHKTMSLGLTNHGALVTEATFKSSKGYDIFTKTETMSRSKMMNNQSRLSEPNMPKLDPVYEKTLRQLTFNKVHQVPEYSDISIPFKYSPIQVGLFQIELVIYFEIYQNSPPITIKIVGDCIEVPIYIEKPIYQFNTCLLNHIYREKIVFQNRSNKAMKVQILQEKETKMFFDFNPVLAYIQANDSLSVWVKLNALKDLNKLWGKYLNKDTQTYEIPFRLVGADQVMPVIFYIHTKMTIDIINLNPTKINFGKFYDKTASRFEIQLENMSNLPQEVLFYPLPKEISIEQTSNPFKILPKEKISTNFIYRSVLVPGFDKRKDESFIKCKIVTGTISTKELRIPYIADIQKCPLEFSSQNIQIPVIQDQEDFQTNISLINRSNKDIIFEFFLPLFEICGIKLTPMVDRLKPEESVQIIISYQSFFKKLGPFTIQDSINNRQKEIQDKIEQEEVKQGDETPTPAGPAKKVQKKEEPPKKLNKQQQQALEEEQKLQEQIALEKEQEEKAKRRAIEESFDFERELLKLGGKLIEFNAGAQDYQQHYTWLIPCYFKNQDSGDSSKQVTYLEISTVTTEMFLQLSQKEIDFGQVAVGIKETREITIHNNQDIEAIISPDILHYFSGFTILNALRPVYKDKPRNIVLQFQPHEQQNFDQIVKIGSKTTWVSCKLKGQGVRPSIKINPDSGLLFMGGCLVNDQIQKTFEIENSSEFNIKFDIRVRDQGIQNYNNSKNFSFIPQQATIKPNSKLQIQILFKPDRISERFYSLIYIDVPNQQLERSLFIWGGCYNRSGYIQVHKTYPELPNVQELQNAMPKEQPFDHLKINDLENVFSPLNQKMVLEFLKINNENEKVESTTVRKVTIGNSKILFDPKLEKAFNFDIVMPKDDKFFVCDVQKGTVAAGSETVVSFKFKPPMKDPFISTIEALDGLGQWIELKVECKLSGGYVPQGVQDQLTIDIFLKAYINTI